MKLTWALTSGVVALSIYRAATQSITHDEALSYLLFVDGDWRHLYRHVDNQNHVLASLLSRVAVQIFGATELSVRVPGLVGAVIYCTASGAIARQVFEGAIARAVVVGLLTLNPYVLDFLSAARGYALALGFVMTALYWLLLDIRDGTARRHLACGAALGAATAANLTSVFPSFGIVMAAAVLGLRQRGPKASVRALATMVATATAVAGPLLAVPLWRWSRRDYYFGASTIMESVGSLIHTAWRHQPFEASDLPGMAAREQPWSIALLAVIGIAAVVGLRHVRRPDSDRAVAADAAAVTAIVAVSCAVALIAAHLIAGVKYPLGRTGLYWVPCATALVTFAVAAEKSWRARRLVAAAIAVVVLGHYVRSLQTTCYADWVFDSGTRAAVDYIERARAASNASVRIGGSWEFEPSLNFYRVVRRLDWIEPIERAAPAPGFDYYLLRRRDAPFISALTLSVIRVAAEGDNLLARPSVPALSLVRALSSPSSQPF